MSNNLAQKTNVWRACARASGPSNPKLELAHQVGDYYLLVYIILSRVGAGRLAILLFVGLLDSFRLKPLCHKVFHGHSTARQNQAASPHFLIEFDQSFVSFDR